MSSNIRSNSPVKIVSSKVERIKDSMGEQKGTIEFMIAPWFANLSQKKFDLDDFINYLNAYPGVDAVIDHKAVGEMVQQKLKQRFGKRDYLVPPAEDQVNLSYTMGASAEYVPGAAHIKVDLSEFEIMREKTIRDIIDAHKLKGTTMSGVPSPWDDVVNFQLKY